MTEQPAPAEQPMPDPYENLEPEDADSILQFLVGMANDHDWSMGVTLFTASGPVSGTIVSLTRWFDAYAKAGADSSEAAGAFTAAIRDKLVEMQAEAGEAAQPNYTLRYIHLIDAHFVSGDQVLPGQGERPLLWRGRLSQVSGWTPMLITPRP